MGGLCEMLRRASTAPALEALTARRSAAGAIATIVVALAVDLTARRSGEVAIASMTVDRDRAATPLRPVALASGREAVALVLGGLALVARVHQLVALALVVVTIVSRVLALATGRQQLGAKTVSVGSAMVMEQRTGDGASLVLSTGKYWKCDIIRSLSCYSVRSLTHPLTHLAAQNPSRHSITS